MAKYHIGEYATVQDGPDGIVYVTRPSMISNQINTVPLQGADTVKVVEWLADRMTGGRTAPLVQEAFPQLSDAEREFLMTGITEKEWATSVAVGDDE